MNKTSVGSPVPVFFVQNLDELSQVQLNHSIVSVDLSYRSIDDPKVVDCHDETQPWLGMLHSDSVAGSFETPHLTSEVHLVENAFVDVDNATSRLDNFQEGHGPALPKYPVLH